MLTPAKIKRLRSRPLVEYTNPNRGPLDATIDAGPPKKDVWNELMLIVDSQKPDATKLREIRQIVAKFADAPGAIAPAGAAFAENLLESACSTVRRSQNGGRSNPLMARFRTPQSL